jgi:hypothetical protein
MINRTKAKSGKTMPFESLYPRNLFGTPSEAETFAGLGQGADAESHPTLRRIAAKIGATRRPAAASDIPAGATYLAQFASHDLDFRGRVGDAEHGRLDLGLIYGDGPKHDSFCYQLPERPGAPRHLLRVGRTRPSPDSPAWGAARDLPRASCPHLDNGSTDDRTEALIPNAFSDSNAILAQFQMVWVLMHNALPERLAPAMGPGPAFEVARSVNRRIYHACLRNDVLGTWLHPRLRTRYCAEQPTRLSQDFAPVPVEYIAGVARLGHGLVREIYALNDQRQVMGLRDILRHTSLGRPHQMPLTEDWLVDFSRFFEIGASVPQRTRALGPHVARPFASGTGEKADGLVLRDLVASARNGVRSVRSLIERVRGADTHLLEGCFAQDESTWSKAVRDWLAGTGLSEAEIDRLASDPPLTLFLMLEAEADTGGRSLGMLGSVIMGETLTAAMDAVQLGEPAWVSRAFDRSAPASMAEVIRYLQTHYRFADGARLHGSDTAPDSAVKSIEGTTDMLDNTSAQPTPIPRIEVADFVEMGRLVAGWATGKVKHPENVAELVEQLDGIAVVPERIKTVEVVQSTLDHLILRLPVREMIEESERHLSDPMANGRYPFPQFYEDFYSPGFGPVMTPLETLYARVGDYTIAQCR